jgi:hypothetical protein
MDVATQEQDLEFYRREGFLSPITLMSESEALGHRRALEAAEARLGPMHYKTKPYFLFSSANELGRHPKLLDAVEALIGPDILLWDSAYVIKEAGNAKKVSWHQDLTYWGLSSDQLVTAWVALSPATLESGCMQFWPGSHRNGKIAHRDTYAEDNILHRGQTVEAEIPEEALFTAALRPGQASLHHGWLMHGSGPNSSGDRRIGLTLQYLAPSVKQLFTDKEGATLVRGEDRYGHFVREPDFTTDFDPALIAYREEAERLKHEVYDSAT